MEEIVINGIGSELQGVGRLADGRAVFVPGALLGERVKVNIVHDQARFCEGELAAVLEPSPARVKSACPMAGVCGGCQARSMTYEESLKYKKQKVIDALTRIGGVKDAFVYDVIGCQEPNRTRNKAEYPIGRGADGNLVIGAFAAGSHAVVALEDCLLQNQASVKALNWVRENLNRLPGMSRLQYLVTRVNRAGKMMATFCGDAPILSDVRAWTGPLCAAVTELESVYFCKLSRRVAHALDGVCTKIWGAERLEDTLLGLRFALSPQSFFQVNPEQTEILYQKALEAADIGAGQRILDAYCGAGTISLAAARTAKHVTGVEIVAPAIADARQNAQRNGLTDKTRFLCGDAAREIPRLISAGERFDAAILDPPRKGADAALIRALIEAKIPRISYISCNPATLARDVKLLAEDGYQLKWAQPVDMFPYTGHIETVCLMSKE